MDFGHWQKHTICTEQECNEAQKQTFVQCKCNGTQTQINGIERIWNGNFFISAIVFNKDLILELIGCLWL